ncbi:MAG: DUF2971 domain-containing protein [Clostridia bacterium]|nr:DUF2971 domain-containing protein [Clostridia bacterium]
MSDDFREAQRIFTEMKAGIEKAGGVFYQYRPCKITEDIIYDIENIRNGVVYARSPLYMNDPFDSMIGFSTEKLYSDFCSLVLAMIPDRTTRDFSKVLLENKAFGKAAEFISTLKELQGFLRVQKNKLKINEGTLSEFAVRASKIIYSKMPPGLRRKVGTIDSFVALSFLTADVDLSSITEHNIMDMLNIDKQITEMLDSFESIKDTIYFPKIKDFLSRITISCFSASGWDNQLMWSHYTNSYAGICIEYDFSTVNGETGFVYPVKYKAERPTLRLADIGLQLVNTDHRIETKIVKPGIEPIFSYILTKNECWKYEKEWRIINFGEPDTPIFINLPKIKSITLGLNIDAICKSLLFEVCREKNIPCYELVLDNEKFLLDRRLIDLDNVTIDLEKEILYLQLLYNRINRALEGIGKIDCSIIFDKEAKTVDTIMLISVLQQLNDTYSYAYLAKRSINRIASFFDSFSDEDEKKLKTIKTNIDMIYQLEFDPDQLKNTLRSYKTAGIIDFSDYKKALNLILRIDTFIGRIANEPWNNLLEIEMSNDEKQ